MSIFAPSKSSFGVQSDRALHYGRWLLLGFTLAFMAAPVLGAMAAWGFFAIWAVLCGMAARRGHMLAWTVLCLTPLAMLSLLWLADLNSEDPFELRWAYIIFFAGACMVTGATGILTLLPRDTARHPQFSAQGSNQA